MKRIFPLLFLMASLSAGAQGPSLVTSADPSFQQGYRYLKGIGISADSNKAINLFRQAASGGSGQAMNALGNVYASREHSRTNVDSMIAWYSMAAKAGYPSAWFNLGELYRKGDLIPQDFAKASQYYQQGATAGDDNSKSALAYFYYKGFGVTQDYGKAFALYSVLAPKGIVNAQYFLGLCYRNGYGTAPDAGAAKTWLSKAAGSNDWQAKHELTAEPTPENVSVVSPSLQNEVANLKVYQEQFITAGSNNLSGTYTGYAIYYDFSHQYVHEIVPLQLVLEQSENTYRGVWTENGNNSATISAVLNNDNALSFDSSSQYTRHNYYSYESAEQYRFDEAPLSIKYLNDSVYLCGDVRFYSLSRKEPGQPIFITLSKKIEGSTVRTPIKDFRLSVSPNPAPSSINASFTLPATAKVQLQVIDMNGHLVNRIVGETLPAGSYLYNLGISQLANGTYILQLVTDEGTQEKKFIKML